MIAINESMKTTFYHSKEEKTSLMTPRRDGGAHKTPTVNNLSRDKVVVSTATDDISMEDSKTQSNSTADTDEFLSHKVVPQVNQNQFI